MTDQGRVEVEISFDGAVLTVPVRAGAGPNDPDLLRYVHEVLLRLVQLRALEARARGAPRGAMSSAVVDPALTSRVARFAVTGSCPECGRRDSLCRIPDPPRCAVAEVMES